MDPVFTGLLCIAIACVLYLVFSRRQAVVNYPDGPSPLPLIGNMHQVIMAGSLVEFLELNRKRFGNVFTVTFGAVPKVIVSSYDLLQDVFIRNADNTSDRVINILPAHLVDILSATPGLIWASFPHWKSMRTFALNVLREEGMGKSSLEPQILDEVHTYISTFLVPNEGKSFNITDSLTMATSNIISVMAFGQRFHYDDRMFNQLVTAVQSSVKASLRVGATKNMPWLRFLPGDLTGSKLSAQSNEITREVGLGEALARMEFFLFFTSILQRYTVTASHEVAVGRSQLFSLINAPQPHEVVFKPRQLQA